MKKRTLKVLLIRLDKIGDLICTLPADQALDSQVYEVTWVVQKGLGQLLELGEKKRAYIELDKSNPKLARQQFSDFLKNNKFDYAISFQCPWWINWLIFKHRIHHRIGVLSQWHSFLFLNAGLRQKRSTSEKHEFNYNLDLVQKITGPLSKQLQSSSQLFFKFKKPQSTQLLEKFNLAPNYIVVHPGMMGSALNISQTQYIHYILHRVQQGHQIVITGTAADEPYLTEIKNAFQNTELWQKQIHWLQGKLQFSELLQILNYASEVIAPSTGVAHLAAALDKKVIGVYSPIQVHHPKRWAPRGENVQILLPNVHCPSQFQCLKEKCAHYNCMNTIQFPEV